MRQQVTEPGAKHKTKKHSEEELVSAMRGDVWLNISRMPRANRDGSLVSDSYGDFVTFNPVAQYAASSILGKATNIINSELIRKRFKLLFLFYFKGIFQGFQCTKCPDSMFVIIIKDNYEQYLNKQINK